MIRLVAVLEAFSDEREENIILFVLAVKERANVAGAIEDPAG
jgi:hypothetical protein